MNGFEATELVSLHLKASAESSVKVASVYIEEVQDLGPRALEVVFSDGTRAVVTVNVE